MSAQSFEIISSVDDELPSLYDPRGTFRSWRFAAVSDDGSESVIITFYDNYPFSPRYIDSLKDGPDAAGKRHPAVSFVYAVEGKSVMRSLNEYCEDDARIGHEPGTVGIAGSSFKHQTADYGRGYVVDIDLITVRRRRIRGKLEWLSIESDLSRSDPREAKCGQTLNLVAARSDVSGRVELTDPNGKEIKLVHFRGTGSHEMFCCRGPFTSPIESEYVGAVHYSDITAFFFNAVGASDTAKLVLIKDQVMETYEASPDRQEITREMFGLRVPRRMTFATPEGMRLRVKPVRLIRSGFCEVDMLSEMTLIRRDGNPRKAIGITQFIEPRHAKRRLVRLLSNLGTGRNGKPPIF